MNTETIARRSNGTIDVDFYRARALRQRSAARATALRSAGCFVCKAAQLCVASLTHVARRPMPDPGAAMLIAQAAVRRPSV
jgi:hypothetical protein